MKSSCVYISFSPESLSNSQKAFICTYTTRYNTHLYICIYMSEGSTLQGKSSEIEAISYILDIDQKNQTLT